MLSRLLGIQSVSCDDVPALAADGKAWVIDVNAPARLSRGRVPGARVLDAAHFSRGDLPADPGTLLVFYCSNPMCPKAPMAARRARALGHANVRVMPAGIQGWLAAGLPVSA